MTSFTIQVLKKGRWLVAGHGDSPFETVTTAKGIKNQPGVTAVKVTTKRRDEDQGRIIEEVIYADPENMADYEPRLKRGAGKSAKRGYFARNSQSWLIAAALIVGIVGNLGLAIAFGVGVPAQFGQFLYGLGSGWSSGSLVLYDLPPMVLDYGDSDQRWTLRIKIGLEVNDRSDVDDLKYQRVGIVNNVVDLLQGARPELFENSNGLDQLQRAVRDSAQMAVGDVEIKDVLFRSLNFM